MINVKISRKEGGVVRPSVRRKGSCSCDYVAVACSARLPADPITSQNNPIIKQIAVLNYSSLPIARMKEIHASALNVSAEAHSKADQHITN
jgi:predicted aconitase with swiveling domain